MVAIHCAKTAMMKMTIKERSMPLRGLLSNLLPMYSNARAMTKKMPILSHASNVSSELGILMPSFGNFVAKIDIIRRGMLKMVTTQSSVRNLFI
jgi:hypothetical protein